MTLMADLDTCNTFAVSPRVVSLPLQQGPLAVREEKQGRSVRWYASRKFSYPQFQVPITRPNRYVHLPIHWILCQSLALSCHAKCPSSPELCYCFCDLVCRSQNVGAEVVRHGPKLILTTVMFCAAGKNMNQMHFCVWLLSYLISNKHLKNLIPKCNISMQSSLVFIGKCIRIFFRFWLIKSRWFEQLGYNLADLYR
jgi:hypothetical protein